MARQVLVTGATGTLGRKLVGAATAAGHNVRAMSRRSHVGYTGVHWAQGDLRANTGIDAAVEGVDVVVHCATQGTGDKDVTSTENLIAAARKAGVAHIVYVSIVGIDRIPLPYYKTKLRVERALEASRIGHTVLRATQFHNLIEMIFSIQRFSPLLCALGGVRFQPIDTRDVTSRLVELIDCEPAGRVADIGVPPCTHTPSWHACTLLPAAAGAPSWTYRFRGASSPATERVRTWRQITRLAPSASRTISPKSPKVCLAICFAAIAYSTVRPAALQVPRSSCHAG